MLASELEAIEAVYPEVQEKYKRYLDRTAKLSQLEQIFDGPTLRLTIHGCKDLQEGGTGDRLPDPFVVACTSGRPAMSGNSTVADRRLLHSSTLLAVCCSCVPPQHHAFHNRSLLRPSSSTWTYRTMDSSVLCRSTSAS